MFLQEFYNNRIIRLQGLNYRKVGLSLELQEHNPTPPMLSQVIMKSIYVFSAYDQFSGTQ
jgi:hypothetical protein